MRISRRMEWVVCIVLSTLSYLPIRAAAAQAPVLPKDPVPHELITKPYRVCQDLEELTRRIDSLYRKPFAALYHNGIVQPETVYFKDTASGHEVMSLTRELCSDISHPDLERPVWTIDGRKILFMGNRKFFKLDGSLYQEEWPGYKFIMNADYSDQRLLAITFVDSAGKVTGRKEVIDGKFNIMDKKDPRYAYYAVNDTLWRVHLGGAGAENIAEPLCKFVTDHRKIIQDISDNNQLLIQDINPDLDKATGQPQYMPEIHLVDLNKRPGEPGFYDHHAADYGLPEVRDSDGKLIHDAKNSYHFHSLMFTGPNRIGWNYGPMTDVGEYLGWSLDITHGLGGTPVHTEVKKGSSVNQWNQYESHGERLGSGTFHVYFAGPAEVAGKGSVGGWGLWIKDESHPELPPRFVLTAPGGHVAGGNSQDPDHWAAYISAGWRDKVKESDALVGGDTSGAWNLLCYTYSDVRGGTYKDKTTGKDAWSGPDNNDYRPYSSIPRPLLSPDGTKVWFHSSMLDPLETWTGAYVVVEHRPAPPRNLHLSAARDRVQLEWEPALLSHETKGYHVYRGDAGGHNVVELGKIVPAAEGALTADIENSPVSAPSAAVLKFVDTAAQPGNTYTYAVTAEEWSTLESDTTSNSLKVQVGAGGSTATAGPAWKGWDTTPPPPVEGFEVGRDAHRNFILKWQQNRASDVRFYNVYYSRQGWPEVDQKHRIASVAVSATSYVDWSADDFPESVEYAITAVDRQGNESQPAMALWHRPLIIDY